MQSSPYVTFQKFNDHGLAGDLGNFFKENQIKFVIEENTATFEGTFIDNEAAKEFLIKIRKADFKKADEILLKMFATQIDSVEKDYYLFDFTDDELSEIIAKRDEWGPFDFVLAQKILKDRGKEVGAEWIEFTQKERIGELAKPYQSEKTWIYLGYILAALGGFVGFFIGLMILTHKKTLPDGSVVFGYSESDRRQGKIIVIFAPISLFFWYFIAEKIW